MEWLPLFLGIGAIAGLLAGIFGVGGGAVVVPLLMLAFGAMGIAKDNMAHVAVGTSFATIVFTSLGSIWGHSRKQNIDWKLWLVMAPMLAVGVCAGSYVASMISSAYLLPIIGLFFVLVAVQMFFGYMPKSVASTHVSGLSARTASFFIGTASAFFGIGGGTLSVPWLRYYQYGIHRAVGTSAACGLPIAIFGALSYAYFGRAEQVGSLPEYSLGFIFIPAFVGIVFASVPAAVLGARAAAKMPSSLLNRLFALLLLCIGLFVFSSAAIELLSLQY